MVVVLAVGGVVALLVHRARQDLQGVTRWRADAVALHPDKPAAPQRLEASQPLAIEPPRNELHLHFHGMSPAEAAEAIRQAGERT